MVILVAKMPNGSMHVTTKSRVLADPGRYHEAKFAGPFESEIAANGFIQKHVGVQHNSPAGSRPEGRSMYSRMRSRCY